MDPNENANATEQTLKPAETPTTTTPAAPAPRQKRAYHKQPTITKNSKKAPPRTVEDLENISTAKMSDIEKDVYISYLRAMINQKDGQLKNLDDTAKKVFQRGNEYERAFNDLKTQVDRDMQLIRSGITIMAESIINHTYGGK